MGNNNIFDDTEIIWQESNSDGFFSKVGEITTDYKSPKDNLKLDIVLVFKRTTFRAITEYLLQKLLNNSQNIMVQDIVKFIHVIVLCIISPKSTSILFFDNDEYRKIENLFKMEHGERYIEKQSPDNFPQIDSVIKMLIRHNLLEEDGNRYYVTKHILKNLEIKTKPSPIDDLTSGHGEANSLKKTP